MEDKNLQEQYALLEKERKEDRRKTIVIIILCILIILVTLLGLYFAYSSMDRDGTCKTNCKVTATDGKEYILNIDYNNDGVPHFNLDTNNDGIPDTNLINQDRNNDGKCDLNCDTDGDGKPDTNIDFDNDKIADINIDTTGDGKADTNVDSTGDGKCDTNCVDNFESNANLKSLSVDGYTLSPLFNENTTEYSISVKSTVEKVNVSAEAVNPKSSITGLGEVSLVSGNNRVSIVVVAQDGSVKTYHLNILKSSNPVVVEDGNGSYDINTIENNVFLVSYTKDLNVENIIPGWYGSQTFTVTNKSDATIVYDIHLIDVENTFKNNDFKYELVKDSNVLVEKTDALTSDGAIYSKLVLAPGESADFAINYEFVERGQDQNENINVKYHSKVEIRIVSVN